MQTMQLAYAILALFCVASTATLLPPSAMKPIQLAEEHAGSNMHRHPNEYEIELAPGHSIEDHFTTIGKDLTHHIKRRYDNPELDLDYVAFIIRLEDEEDLNLVRRDAKVALIAEFAQYSPVVVWTDEIDGIVPKPVEPAEEQKGFHLHTVADEYEVRLFPGCSIEDVFKSIGKDLEKYIVRRWDRLEVDDPVDFIIHLEDEEDLNLIRWCTKVARIGVAAQYSQIDLWTTERDGHERATEVHDEL